MLKYENAYRGVSRLLLAEILGMIPIFILLFYPRLFSLGILSLSFLLEYLPWISLGVSLLVCLMRLLALGRAAQDEVTFTLGQKLAVFSLLFFLANQYLLPPVVNYLTEAAYRDPSNVKLFHFLSTIVQLLIPLGYAITSIWVMLNVVAGIYQLAKRIHRGGMQAQGRGLTMMIMLLILGALIMFALPLFVSKSTLYNKTFQTVTLILVLVFLAAILLCWIWYLLYLFQARHMLRGEKEEEANPWANPSVTLDQEPPQPW